MSVKALREQIKVAMKLHGPCDSPHITVAEAKKLEQATVSDGFVSPSEGKEWQKLLGKAHETEVGGAATAACPENGSDFVTIESGALKLVNAMFVGHNVPYGENQGALRRKISHVLDNAELGEKLAKAPSTAGLHEVNIDDRRPVDGLRRDAYLNAKTNEVFVKMSGWSRMDRGEIVSWYGPVPLKNDPAQEVKKSTVDKLRKKFLKLFGTQDLKYTANSLPVGARFVEVPLLSQKHPDGYSWSAAIPLGPLVGPGQGGAAVDPNKVKEFYIVRTGGIAGLTSVSDLIKL